MDQNTSSTPRGGPVPKRVNLGRPVYNDSNIEQTLLIDTTNFAQLQQSLGQKQADASAVGGDDSLDECSFMNDIRSAHTTLDLPAHSKPVNLSLVREDDELSSTLTLNATNPDQKENTGDFQSLLDKCAEKEHELRNLSANLLLSPVKEDVEMEVDGKENEVEEIQLEKSPSRQVTLQSVNVTKSPTVPGTPLVSNTSLPVHPTVNDTHEVTQSFCLSPQQSDQFRQVEEVKMTPQSASFRVQADVHEPKTNLSFGMSPAPAELSKHPNTPMNGDLIMEPSGVTLELVKSTLEEVKNATLQTESFVMSPAVKVAETESHDPPTPLSLSIQANTIHSEQPHSQQDPTKNITLYEQSFVLSSKTATPRLNTSRPDQKSPFAKVRSVLGSLIRSPSSSKSRKRSITLMNTPEGKAKFEELGERSFQTPKTTEDAPVLTLSKDPEIVVSEFYPQDTMCMDVANVSVIDATPGRTPLQTPNRIPAANCSIQAPEHLNSQTPARSNLQVPATTPARGADLNATLSEFVEVSSLVRDIVEAEVPVESEKIDNFSDKLSNLDFMMAEYAVAILNRQPSKVLMSEITDNLGDCVRSLIQLVSDSSKTKHQLLIEKERADFEHALDIERQKAKNGMQERQMLCARIEELEEKEGKMKAKEEELEDELKRCMDSLDEADSLENELLRYKAKCAELEQRK